MIELPVCRYRGEVKSNGRYPCTSPFLLVHPEGVYVETCKECRYADRVPTMEEESILPPFNSVGQKRVEACVHLGEATGETIECPTCVGKVRVKLFACSVHGKCVLAKSINGVQCCQTCIDYQV